HRSAVLLERGDRLVRRHLLDHHEQSRGPRLQVLTDLLLECLVDSLRAEVAEQSTHARAEREAGKRDEEEDAEQQSPETTPRRAPTGGRPSVRRLDVILALHI